MNEQQQKQKKKFAIYDFMNIQEQSSKCLPNKKVSFVLQAFLGNNSNLGGMI